MATQPHESEMGDEEAKELEMLRRILFSLMLPTTRVASTQEFPLKELTTLLRLAYFRQLRGRGKTLREIGDTLDVSVRTAKRLSQRLKENFFMPELEHELPRRIEFMLWAAPMSLARLNQVIEDADLDEIEAALDQLLDQERAEGVEDRPGFYTARKVETRLVKDSMVSRIGALNSFLGNVTNAIQGRFFGADPTSFVRTLSFRITPEQLTELRAIYEQLYEQLREMEQTSTAEVAELNEEELLEMQLSICWAPYAQESSEED